MPYDKAKSLVTLALAGHLGAAVAVILGYGATGASALLALAILLLVVVAHHAVLLSGLAQAQRPSDARHPFGHGRELYFWSFVAAVLLFAHGAGVAIFEGISKLKAPEFVSLGTSAQAMLFLALLTQAGIAYLWTTAWPASEAEDTSTASRDPVRTALATANIAAALAALIALAGLNAAEHSGLRAGDAAAALLIGFIMAIVAALMSIRTKAVLIGEAATPAVRTAVRTLLQRDVGPGRPIAAVHDVKTLELGGGDLLISAEVRFKGGETVHTVAETTERLRAAIHGDLPQVSHFFLSVLPGAEPERIASSSGSPAAPAPEAPQVAMASASNPPDPRPTDPRRPHDHGSHKGGRKKRRH